MINKLNQFASELKETYPFYQTFCKEKQLHSKPIDFFQLPVIDKQWMKQHYDQFLHPTMEASYVSYTSGSTGTPFKCIKSAEEHMKLSLAIFKQRRKWGLPIKHNKLVLSNRLLSGENSLLHYANKMAKDKPHMIQGRASSLVAFASYIQKHQLSIPPQLTFVQNRGEAYTMQQKKFLEHVFNVPFMDYYGLEELWGIAFTNDHEELEVDMDSVFVEVVHPDTLQSLPPGEYGEVLVTSFIMKSLPFVRYRTGDIGKLVLKNNKVILQLLPVRTSQITLPEKQFHASIFRYLDRFFYELSLESMQQYQILQKAPDDFQFSYIGDRQIDEERIYSKLQSFLKQYLGTPVKLTIARVEQLVSDEHSGKVHFFRSLIDEKGGKES
ncbi:phenylacetate--CoA ligase family protein [Longirhabdus pacifica]|uniref:phenylacetate--CoA ligase family protein n=1 Tax=Longirhabdus pacifica TaxID=2305227 RepID=UPI0010093C22|nr:phenylacetate--CoA ligase family protein [Longirhabdus pacifica]